jgi:hypothetical protein
MNRMTAHSRRWACIISEETVGNPLARGLELARPACPAPWTSSKHSAENQFVNRVDSSKRVSIDLRVSDDLRNERLDGAG